MSIYSRRIQRASSGNYPFVDANTVRIGTSSYALSGTNIARDLSQLVRYTYSNNQRTTPTNMYGVEIVVSLTTNKVVSVNNRLAASDSSGTPITPSTYVLSGHGIGNGYAGQWLLDNATIGVDIQLLMVVVHLSNLRTSATATQVSLNWSYSGMPLSSYTLTRNGVSITAPSANATTYTDTGLSPSVSYSYTLVGNYPDGSKTEMITASVTTLSTTNGRNLNNEIAWYHMVFPPDNLYISNIPDVVDAVRLSFAVQSGSSVQLGGYTNQGLSALSQQCKAWRSNGGLLVISAGGGAGGQPMIDLSNTTKFVNDIVAIQTTLGCPIDGLDWDLEYNADPNQLLLASNALKSRFGSSFIINYSAGGVSSPDTFENRRTCGAVLHNGGVLLSYSWQFYTVPVSLSDAKARLQWLINGGIPAEKLMVGMYVTSDPSQGWTNAQCISYMTDIKNTMGIHRAMIWADASYGPEEGQWARDMRAVLS